MKKNLHLLTALILLLISSCSSDDSSSDSGTNMVLPKTISMTFPDFPSDNSKEVITYNGNKILTSVDKDSKTVFTYDGNFIVKQMKFDIDDKGNEVKDVEVSYTYENGKLKTRTLKKEFSIDYPNGRFIYKTVYTHVSDNEVTYVFNFVDPKTNIEVKDHQGVLNYKDGNLIKEEFFSTKDQRSTRYYEYDDKNDPLKNILGFNLLLNEVNCGNNNIIKTTSTDLSSTVYLTNYIYDNKGYPTKTTSYTSDGKTIEYLTEYTYY